MDLDREHTFIFNLFFPPVLKKKTKKQKKNVCRNNIISTKKKKTKKQIRTLAGLWRKAMFARSWSTAVVYQFLKPAISSEAFGLLDPAIVTNSCIADSEQAEGNSSLINSQSIGSFSVSALVISLLIGSSGALRAMCKLISLTIRILYLTC